MEPDASAAKRRWAVAIGAGAVLTVLAAALFHSPRSPASPPAARKPAIVLAPAATLLPEETALHDPAPLYLPTEWNSRPVPPGRDPGAGFASYPPYTYFSPEGLHVPLPNDVPATPAEALVANPPGNPLLGLGRTDAPVPTLASRGAFVEIVTAGTGAPVYSAALAGAHPPEGVLWHPLEFVAAVDAAGLVGPLVLTGPSNVDTVNSYFETFLAQTFRVGDRLSPGFYHIRVSP